MLAYEYRSAGHLELIQSSDPAGSSGAVLDVLAAGICGTDLKIARGQHRLYPEGTQRIPGHELVGRVAEVQDPTLRNAPSVGDLVVVAPNMACGRCIACTRDKPNLCEHYESVGLTFDGGFAERVAIPAAAVEQGNLLPVPEGLGPDVAVLTEPMAAVLRGLRAISVRQSDTLLILGAGPIGLLAAAIARTLGVGRVIVSEPSPERRRLALTLGADEALDPMAEPLRESIHRLTQGQGADAVMVTTPVAAVYQQGIEAAGIGGRVNFFAGLPAAGGEVVVDANLVHYRELHITGTTANTLADCIDALALLSKQPERFAPLVTHRFALTDIDEAFAVSARGEALKAVVQP